MKTLRAGITLPEILVVTVIIAVLIAVLLPAALIARRKGDRASCLMNLRQIGLALAAYRQDTGVYPEPGKPIGALAAAYPKLLAKIPHCPSDPERDRDSYGEYYNYWGYRNEALPTSLTSKTDANDVYSAMMDNIMAPATSVTWNANTKYSANAVVELTDYPGVKFRCTLSHTSSDNIKPLYGSDWQRYWTVVVPTTAARLWKVNTPYNVNDVVTEGQDNYLCIKNHVSDDYVDANEDHVPDDIDKNPKSISPPRDAFDPDVNFDDGSGVKHYTTIQSEPSYGAVWKKYWIIVDLPLLWRNDTQNPDSDFPGLVNPNPPSNTIVTVCPFHVRSDRCYTVLRVSGETENVPQSKTSNEFWTLSQMP